MLEQISLGQTPFLPCFNYTFGSNGGGKTDPNASQRSQDDTQHQVACSQSSRAEFATRLVVRLVSNSHDLEETAVMDTSRGSSEISRARQIAMYLLHTSLSIPYGTIAKLFGRDRTTVAHACRTIEDLRDIPASDDAILKLEGILELLAQLAGIDEKTFATR